MRAATIAFLVLGLGAPARARAELIPKVGVDFEHFGESYRLTEDQDTVATIDDYGPLVGLVFQSPQDRESRFRLDSDVQIGKQTRRFRFDFEGRLRRSRNVFEIEHEGLYRMFVEGGDYSVAGDYLDEYAQLAYERELAERLRLRLRETVEITWYQDPNEYNLNTWTHRPGADLRVRVGEFNEVRVGYRLGRRVVPDSTSLEYWRHAGELDLSFLFGWTASLDLSEELERRVYEPGSVRESSWENRVEFTFEIESGQFVTYRLVHEDEVARFDDPDDLDFDFDWVRTGVQVEFHRTRNLDFSVMPVYAFLASGTAPEEEYSETGLEFGIDWRIGERTWVSLSDEVGRRDYEVNAAALPDTLADGSLPVGDATDEFLLGTAFSDYLYNRLTLLASSDVTRGISLHLFANWEPEDHRLNRHDTDSRMISGGLEYRF